MSSPEQTRFDVTPIEPLVVVEGVVERIVYESEDTGFFVARLRRTNDSELVTFVGSLMAVSPGETIRLQGRWVDDRRFGRQLRTESYETLLPSSVEGIEKYLSSGLIQGIGPTYAKRLVEAFGVETLRVIDEHPERLTSVDGIGRKRAKQIREAWERQKSIQSIMVFLQGHGVSTGQAVRIYKQYGEAAVAVLRENPYRLAEDVAGIGFTRADQFAHSVGIEKNSLKRLEAGLVHTLQQAAGDGHVLLPEEELIEKTAALLDVSQDLVPQALDSLEQRGKIVRSQSDVYLDTLYAAESGSDQRLKRLLVAESAPVSIDAGKAIEWVQKTLKLELSKEQEHALHTALTSKVVVITGGPGTGKTTLVRCLLSIVEKKGLTVQLAAPTGRAAKRMENATGHEARTIHRLLEYSGQSGGFTRDEQHPLEFDLFVIDECSMVDTTLFHSLLRAIPNDARLVFVGDVDQLPSVGPGNVLMDIIASGIVPTVRLETVFRQAAQSGIVTNAHRINTGQYPEFNDRDFFFIERTDPQKIQETVVELAVRRMPQRFSLDPYRDLQVLALMHRGAAGVTQLNEALQQALNPSGSAVGRRNFRVGDKVIQLRNNYELDVYNGDVGQVVAVHDDAGELQVQFDERSVAYPLDELDNLGLAYAITVHKAQGSEYPAVVLPLMPQHYLMLQRNLLYTAITRAKQLVVIVGDPKAIRMAVRGTEVTRRHTRLAERLRDAAETTPEN